MYLKALEIQGFKSFPDKTRLTFEKDITAIVGPNGSGKSNISDAILWVMGEQRSKALRGAKMEDVIFGGTQKRSKLGFAEVTLIIDNSTRIIDSDFSELMLTRRYYRSGESEYYINRESVRLKDLNSMLMDTGLGRDGYSIIGQGKIAEIVSTKSTDRREVFEEAAGISRYRYRKEEAERKLEHTADNLLRINDKIEELELQVGPLKEQSETAKKYLSLRDDLRLREISVWMETLDRLHAQNRGIISDFEENERKLEKAKNALDSLYLSSESLSDRMHEHDIQTEKAHEHLSESERKASEIEAAISILHGSISGKNDSMKQALADIEEQKSRENELRQSISEGNARIDEIASEIAGLSTRAQANSNVLEGCRLKIANREKMAEDAAGKVSSLTIELGTVESRISMLSAMQREFEGYSGSVKAVMREYARGTLTGICGPVANLIRTDSEFTVAIETALGAASQNIVTETQNDGKAAIEMLKRKDEGRATFLPLDIIKANPFDGKTVTDPGFVGIASELVSCDDKYSDIVSSLLGRTLIADTITDAIRISNKTGNKVKVVSLDGQVINAGGSMTGGSTSKKAGILSRANELDELSKSKKKIDSKLAQATDELNSAKQALANIKYQYDIALEEQSQIRSEMSSREAESIAVEKNNYRLQKLLESIENDSLARQQIIEQCRREIEVINKRIDDKKLELAAAKIEIEAAKKEISKISEDKLALEAKRVKAQKESQSKNEEIIELERTKSKLEQKKLSAELEEKQIIDKLWDNYQLSHNAAEKIRAKVESLAKENRIISELHRQIALLGNPNIGAIEEYERVNTRYIFLTEQRNDIEKAKSELEKIISDVTIEMKSVFLNQFRLIDEKFRETFVEMFGGGKASLQLEDENNILECGIEINVQPPGKALSTLSLLSGGEMAFVAIALYFAILKVRPTPFCVMDEIEAALDEANVTRYAEYMRRMSSGTQFIVITHRRGTMEEADMLYGVTMQEKGVSSVLRLDLEQAQKTIEN